MTDGALRLEPLPALRLAQLSGEVDETHEIPAMVDDLLGALNTRLTAAGVPLDGRVVRTYYGRPDGSKIDVAVGTLLDPGAQPVAGLELAELPGEDRAAVVAYQGPVEDVEGAWNALDVALAERGLEARGPYRQVHLEDEEGRRVVELQCPVREAGSACP
ncbi:GyrI-like domain-containing protein [Streptoalloteichus hindustanus]|uniref:Effector-binding domain-containing protein n=1 Tax=Streptoalloteichus hindustanus TaxID=2017 RepID=A0A1M5EUH9_STRHI|nr:GyrI-like domain-containing protein [Streptoalloteichus hindustanus]SHF82672.1 effector-binding domain-containing protein [Streptoalloteichus hindustanus]